MTFVGVKVGSGRAALSLTGGGLAPRVISLDPSGAKVALVATTALLLGGDSVRISLRIGPGAWLEIVETAGTVAYDGAGRESFWTVDAIVEDGGLLLWHGEPFVVADGANTTRRSTIELGDGALACLRDTVVLGRTREIGGAVRVVGRVSRLGAPLLVEDLDLREPARRTLPGVIGGARVLDTVTILGVAAPEQPSLPAGTRFDLAGRGSVGRVLRSDLASSPVPHWWTSWSGAARRTYHEPIEDRNEHEEHRLPSRSPMGTGRTFPIA